MKNKADEEVRRIENLKPGSKTDDTPTEGGHGFVTFLIIVIVLAILGALAYVLHKINKGKEQSYSFVKYGQG